MWRKSLGFISALLALNAISHPAVQEQPAIRGAAPAESKSIRGNQTEQHAAAPTAEEGPWNAVCNQHSGAPHWACVAAPRNLTFTFLIATVPDPKATNLSLFFDRSMESLVSAGADSGYSFERNWLPWKSHTDTELMLLSDRVTRRLEQERIAGEPGLVVLRRSQPLGTQLLLLFVVGETPTSGINRIAFGHALDHITEISKLTQSTVPCIHVVGPTFSGSLAPLAADLETRLRDAPGLNMHFISGTVTGADAVKVFTTSKLLAPFIRDHRIRYEAVIENDNVALQRFREYLESLGKGPREMALLAEDETEYGALDPPTDPNNHEEQWLVVRYPRQIARLRNAYQESDGVAASKDLPSLEGVKFTLKDSADSDALNYAAANVPDFSKQQGPASQYATLLSIGSSLRHERADYIGITATDVLDSIFLSRFLRRSCPDARIFVLDADLLFTEEADTSALAGMFSVTTYPLFPRNQHWTKAQIKDAIGRRVHFTSRTAEGVYNACRALLQIGETWDPLQRDYLLEYTNPANLATHRPPLWLTVLGRDGYWPVALLDPTANGSVTLFDSNPPRVKRASGSQAGLNDMHAEPPSRGWYLLFWLIVMVSLLHCIYVMYLLSLSPVVESSLPVKDAGLSTQVRLANKLHVKVRAGLEPNESWRRRARKGLQIARDSVRALGTIFSVYNDSSMQHRYGHKLPFLTAATLVLACALGVLTLALRPYWSLPFGTISVHYDVWRIFYAGMAAGCWILLIATCAALFWRSGEPVRSRRIFDPKTSAPQIVTSLREYWPVTLLTLVVAIASLSIFAAITFSNYDQRGFFFAYRSLMLTSGVSPLMPILIMVVAYYYWAWIQLRREDMIARRQYFKSRMEAVHASAPKIAQEHMDRVDGTLDNIFSIHVWRPALLFISIWLLVFQPWRTLRTIEPLAFDVLYLLVLTTLYWMLALCWTQFIWIWHDFRKLLQWIERDPIRNAFSRLRKEITWVPLVSHVREHQYLISTRCIDTLAALRNFDDSLFSGADKLPLADLKTRFEEELKTRNDRANTLVDALEARIAGGNADVNLRTYADLQAELDKIAGVILEQLELHQWRSGDSDSVRREQESETTRSLSPARCLVVLEEEFIALRYLMFMRYIFRHLRNLLGFIVVGFILAAISLQSYVFQSRHWIGFSSICVFLALGVGVAVVFAEMDRDAILSRITETKTNELGKTFVFRLVQFGALPLITVLAGQFPFLNRLFFSWVRPAFDSLR